MVLGGLVWRRSGTAVALVALMSRAWDHLVAMVCDGALAATRKRQLHSRSPATRPTQHATRQPGASRTPSPPRLVSPHRRRTMPTHMHRSGVLERRLAICEQNSKMDHIEARQGEGALSLPLPGTPLGGLAWVGRARRQLRALPPGRSRCTRTASDVD